MPGTPAGSNALLSLSVVIPTHRRPDCLARVLKGLSEQTLAVGEFEVIVVMDGPCAETRALLEKGSFPFSLRYHEQPAQGAAAARNRGVRDARGRLVLFLDDDVVPVRGFLEAHLKAHDQPGLVVFGGVELAPDAPNFLVAEMMDWSREHFNRCSTTGYEPTEADLLGGNMSVAKHAVQRAGAWDEKFLGHAGDDDRELGTRLRNLGLRLYFEPKAFGHHYDTRDWARLLTDRRGNGRAHRHYATLRHACPRQLDFVRWATGSAWRRAFFRAAGYAPEFLFSAFYASVARGGKINHLRFGKRLLRLLIRASAGVYYLRGFWDDPNTAKQLYSQFRTKIPILCYHRIERESARRSPWSVTLAEFERHLEYLSEWGYRMISLRDFCDWQQRLIPLPDKPVILTFDDGYDGFQKCVAPRLDRFGFRATIFLIAGKMGGKVYWRGEPPLDIMGQQEVQALAQAGFHIEVHGVTHLDWTRVSADAVQQELLGSAAIIKRMTGRQPAFVAYPFGAWNRDVRDAIVRLGFAGACTTDSGPNGFNQDPYSLKRHYVFPGTTKRKLLRMLV